MKHTPGPWVQDDPNWDMIAIIDTDDSYTYIAEISELNSFSNEIDKANAKLIAAAPELLEELICADEAICTLCKIINPQHEDCTYCNARDSRLKVIKKIEGVK